MELPPAVEMRQITKRFPGVLANDHVDFSARWGEVHAIVGENGAGKSTLMNILYGLHRPDSGEILVSGRAVRIRNPRDSAHLGIGMVHQHFMLIPAFTALENIVLGEEPTRLGAIDYGAAEKRVIQVSERFGLRVDLRARVSDISVSAQQKVEILKALYRNARILILDEPTGVLAPQEIDGLFRMLRGMAGDGMTVILISHKLHEVTANSDRVTVLRQGKSVACTETASVSAADLARLMVGEHAEHAAGADRPPASERVVLSVTDMSVLSNKGVPSVSAVSFDVHAGEILGVAGVDGNGQRELAEALVGLRSASGSAELEGRDILRMPLRGRLDLGIAFIPEDRQKYGLVPAYGVEENCILGMHFSPPLARLGVQSRAEIRRHASSLVRAFDIRGVRTDMPVRFLSGGNQQKLIVARALSRNPKLLIASQPTRGLDVQASQDIHDRLLAERARGAAVLLISCDLDEILELSDRVMVMFRGRVAGILDRRDADRERIGALMLGAHDAI